MALYGYILCLEGIAVKSAKYCSKIVQNFYGTKNVSRFLDVHGEEDPDHLDKALSILENISEDRLNEVEQTMLTSFYFYGEILEVSKSARGIERRPSPEKSEPLAV